MSRILFISHELSRTGAPKVLIRLLKHLKRTLCNTDIEVIALRGGPLREELKEIMGPIRIANSDFFRFVDKLLSRVFKNTRYKPGSFFLEMESKRHFNKNYALIYANTIVSLPLGCRIKAKSKNCRLIAHVHELKTNTQILLPEFSTYLDKVDQFIAASDLVRDELISDWGVCSSRIALIHSFTEKKNFSYEKSSLSRTFEIGSAGYVQWMKGYDLFIQIAYNFKKKYPTIPVRFRWIGSIDRKMRLIVEADIKKAGLSEYVSFIGELNEPFHFFNELDVFLHPSREEPFGLVCAEAGMLGKPIVCFESGSGIASIVEKGKCGTVVPYLDCESMADALASYWNDNAHYHEHSNAAKNVFSEFTPAVQVPKIIEVIKRTLINKFIA